MPKDSDRRRFIKGAVAVAGMAAVAKAGNEESSSTTVAAETTRNTSETAPPAGRTNTSFAGTAKPPVNHAIAGIRNINAPKNANDLPPLKIGSGEVPFDRDQAAFDKAVATLRR